MHRLDQRFLRQADEKILQGRRPMLFGQRSRVSLEQHVAV
jgi:hypothetical protein